jgi:hypothetical protein
MDITERTIVGIAGISTIPATVISCRLIVSYLKEKPPGMQTFNDLIMIDYIHTFILFCVISVSTYAYGSVLAPVEYELAQTVSFTAHTAILLTCLYLLTVLVLRYVSIYHSTLLSEHFDEGNVINYLRISLLSLSIFLETSEVMLSSNMENSIFVQVLMYGDTTAHYKIGKVTGFIMIVSLVSMIGLQARIEYDNIAIGTNRPGFFVSIKNMFHVNQVNPNPEQPVPYKLSALRIGVLISALFVIFLFILMPLSTSIIKMVVLIGMAYFALVGLPVLFIWSNANIKVHAVKKIKSVFCKSDPLINLNV